MTYMSGLGCTCGSSLADFDFFSFRLSLSLDVFLFSLIFPFSLLLLSSHFHSWLVLIDSNPAPSLYSAMELKLRKRRSRDGAKLFRTLISEEKNKGKRKGKTEKKRNNAKMAKVVYVLIYSLLAVCFLFLRVATAVFHERYIYIWALSGCLHLSLFRCCSTSSFADTDSWWYVYATIYIYILIERESIFLF